MSKVSNANTFMFSTSNQDANSESVGAVVVTYNRADKLVQCIHQLLRQKCNVRLVPIIVDNASTDDTYEKISDLVHDGRILYFNTGGNLGGAGGFSFGMNAACRLGFKWLWLMDDDCYPSETALDRLISADEALGDTYGFLCSKVLWKDGSICTMNVPRETVYRNLDLQKTGNNLTRVTMASFVSLFLPTRRVYQYGLPIKEFFIWTDDWEFTRRISRNLPCYIVPASVVDHHSTSNMGANIVESSEDRLDRFSYLYRNDVYLYKREGFRGFLYEFLRLTRHVLMVLLRSKSLKRRRIEIIVGSTFRGFAFDPSIDFPGQEG